MKYPLEILEKELSGPSDVSGWIHTGKINLKTVTMQYQSHGIGWHQQGTDRKYQAVRLTVFHCQGKQESEAKKVFQGDEDRHSERQSKFSSAVVKSHLTIHQVIIPVDHHWWPQTAHCVQAFGSWDASSSSTWTITQATIVPMCVTYQRLMLSHSQCRSDHW